MRRSIAVLILAVDLAGCGGGKSASAPSPGPSPTPSPPAPVQLAVFSDPASSFMTSDVRDVDNQIVRFDAASSSLIWAADGRMFPGYPASGNFIASDRRFQIRFGTKDGERRAYFTETSTATICDISVINNSLSITGTLEPVPAS